MSAIRYMEPLTLKASVRVKARVLTTEWSALNEAVYAVGPVAESLRISELMYHPKDPNTEFIELTNVGTETINLALVRFSQGIDFTFPAMDLAPGRYGSWWSATSMPLSRCTARGCPWLGSTQAA